MTDEASLRAAVAVIERDEGAVGVLVNNAGYSQSGAVEAQPHAAYRRGWLARLGGEPDAVARVIERAIRARRPRPRYPVTPSAWLLVTLRALLPDRFWDRFVGAAYPRPGGGDARRA